LAKVIKRFTCKETNKLYNIGSTYETSDKNRLEYLSEKGFLVKEVTKKTLSGKK